MCILSQLKNYSKREKLGNLEEVRAKAGGKDPYNCGYLFLQKIYYSLALDTIVVMGLFMDHDGIPLAFDIYPGNKNEQPTLKPLEKKILKDSGTGNPGLKKRQVV